MTQQSLQAVSMQGTVFDDDNEKRQWDDYEYYKELKKLGIEIKEKRKCIE